ncbi:MAG: site-specific tyrosine recombinase XerD [Bacteroidaceae bacterium]|nr:site-specific tyrosine recombinase XerD [Bacteroidaceae bacterium]
MRLNEKEGSLVSKSILRRYVQFLRLERGFSANTLDAYMRDLDKLLEFYELEGIDYRAVTLDELNRFVATLFDLGISRRSVARIVSGVHAFYRFLVLESELETDPTELLESPSRGEHLPDVMSLEEIEMLIDAVDLTKAEGIRDRAILEMLYSCGLRVSELCGLKLSDVFLDEGFIRVHGKGKKERLVPLSTRAVQELQSWFADRDKVKLKQGMEDVLFVSVRRGSSLSRVTVFHIIKELCLRTGLRTTISPHTFRHSFATHLLEGGANLRAIQEMLGHEDIGTTEIYMHIDRSKLRDEILAHHPRNLNK